MTQFDTTLFKGIVRNVAYKYAEKVNKALYSFEDVEQELWEKLYKVYQDPKDPFKNLPQVEQIKSAKVFLANRMKDILRARFRCIDEQIVPATLNDEGDTSQTVLESFAFSDGASSSDLLIKIANSAISLEAVEEETCKLCKKTIAKGCWHLERKHVSFPNASFKAVVDQISQSFYSVEKDFLYTELRGLIFEWIETQNGPVKKVMTEKLAPSKQITAKWNDLCDKYPRYKGYESIPGTTLCDLLGIERKWWYQALRDLKEFLNLHGYAVMA
jgi:hypothetical protein